VLGGINFSFGILIAFFMVRGIYKIGKKCIQAHGLSKFMSDFLNRILGLICGCCFGTNGYLKMIDFGFAKVVTKRTFTICGTPEYIAPEILLNQGHGKPVDWWCLGVLVYEMLAGFPPFQDEDPMNIYRKIINTKPKYPDGFDS
jgi:serine/threonine protein kinase